MWIDPNSTIWNNIANANNMYSVNLTSSDEKRDGRIFFFEEFLSVARKHEIEVKYSKTLDFIHVHVGICLPTYTDALEVDSPIIIKQKV